MGQAPSRSAAFSAEPTVLAMPPGPQLWSMSSLRIFCVFGVNHEMRRGAGPIMFPVLGLALAPWQAQI